MSAEILKPFGMAPPTGEPEAQVVAVLGGLLEKAKRGEIIGFAGTMVMPDNSVKSVSAVGSASAIAVLGAVRLLEHDLIERFWPAGGRAEPPPAA